MLMCVCMYACMYACVYACMYACVYACMYACMRACAHVHVRMCMCMCMCMCACVPARCLGVQHEAQARLAVEQLVDEAGIARHAAHVRASTHTRATAVDSGGVLLRVVQLSGGSLDSEA
jgi:hypothetical protein